MINGTHPLNYVRPVGNGNSLVKNVRFSDVIMAKYNAIIRKGGKTEGEEKLNGK